MIVVDAETTGINPKSHSILSIGALDFSHPDNTFYAECRMRAGAVATRQALAINGFTLKEIRDPNKNSLKRITTDFLDWAAQIPDHTLAGENVSGFDMEFLRDSTRRYGLPWPFGYRAVDLHSRSFSDHLDLRTPVCLRDGSSNLKLNTTLEFVGLPASLRPFTVHNALEDAMLEAEAFSRLIYGTNLLPAYISYPIPTYLIDRRAVQWAGH